MTLLIILAIVGIVLFIVGAVMFSSKYGKSYSIDQTKENKLYTSKDFSLSPTKLKASASFFFGKFIYRGRRAEVKTTVFKQMLKEGNWKGAAPYLLMGAGLFLITVFGSLYVVFYFGDPVRGTMFVGLIIIFWIRYLWKFLN